MYKSISMSWLAKTDLGNLNSGEGAGNITEMKLYDNHRKPYVSGQAVRRALFDTIQRSYPEHFHCSPETPCTDIVTCWGCDLRGFLSPEKETGGQRRWSPIKVTPALGQLRSEIISDLLTRHSDIGKEDRKSTDMRLAHVQMTENIYKLSLVIDIANVGKEIRPKIEKSGKKEKVTGYKVVTDVSIEERKKRVMAVLDGIYHLSGFAKQSRAMNSLSPEILLISLKKTYNQRGLSVLDLDDEGNLKNLDGLHIFLKEHEILGDQLCVGWTPGIIKNEAEVREVLDSFQVPVISIIEAIEWAKSQLRECL
jgi:CRISPR-associated protein Cst2